MLEQIRIIPTAEQYVEGFRALLDTVARERRYIGFIEAPPIESVREFLKKFVAGDEVQFLAVTEGKLVVGWCDIIRNPVEGFRHVGRLGMGLLSQYRGRGLGRQLVKTTLDAAYARQIERIELEVFASNTGAIEFYRKLGFKTEGTKRRARKLDGEYDDNVLMALLK